MTNLDPQNGTAGVNGVTPHVEPVPGPQAFVDYPARSSTAIEPGKMGSIPYRLRRAASIVDVIGSSEIEIVSAAFGRRRIDLRTHASQSMADALRAEPCEAVGGAYCVVTVRNKGLTAQKLEVHVRVTNEHGPEVDSHSPFRMIGDASAIGMNGARTRSSSSSSNVSKSPSASRVVRGRPPPGASDKERAKERKARAEERATRAHGKNVDANVITVAPVVQPPDEHKVITLFRAYAETLNIFFTFRAPIRRQQRPAIVHALGKAHKRDAGSTVSVRPGEISIVLSGADVKRLYDAVRLRREYQLADVSTLHAAIKKALAGEAKESVARVERAQHLAALSLTHAAPPGVTGEQRSELANETEAMLADGLSITSTPVDHQPE